MPRLAFWYSPTDSILWTFDRHPEIGEEIMLGDRGIFRVIGKRLRPELEADVFGYDCERVRNSTNDDFQAMLKRGVNRLP